MHESASSIESVQVQRTGKLPRYLFRRDGYFYFKRKIPADVRHAFGGKNRQTWKSLGTKLLEKAKVLLAVEVSEFDFLVAKLRRTHANRAAGVPVVEALEVRSGAPSAPNVVVYDGVQQSHLELVRSLEEGLRRLTAMLPTASVSEEAKPAVASAAISVIAAPALTKSGAKGITSSVATRKPTLTYLLEDWKLKQARKRSIDAVENAVHEFRDIHGSLAVEDITRQHARDYRDHLLNRGLSNGTIENRVGFLATLVNHGMVEIVEDLARNPFAKIPVSGGKGLRKPKDRRAYEISELNTLFSSPLYTGEYQAKGQVLEAAYWLPLMGPFVGARIEEVCQMALSDVQCVNGVWCIRLCNLGEDQELKNDGSFRRVPLHEELIQCGFLLHAAEMARAGHSRIFPSLRNDNCNEIYSNAAGKWYGRYIGTIGLTDHRLDYHSFRYSFRQQCSLCDIEEEPRDALTGHWVGKSDGGRTYLKGENKQYPFKKLVAAIGKLQYDELRTSHLHVPEPMAGVREALIR